MQENMDQSAISVRNFYDIKNSNLIIVQFSKKSSESIDLSEDLLHKSKRANQNNFNHWGHVCCAII